MPERKIRRYLDTTGGTVEVPAHNLLTTWGLAEFEDESRATIRAALARVGVATSPDLDVVDFYSRVTLFVVPEQPSPPAGAGAGRRPRSAFAERVRRTIMGRRGELASVGPAENLRAAVAAGRPEVLPDRCAVCRRPAAADLAGGWASGDGGRLCPACQAEGWRLRPGGGLPFRSSVTRS